MIVSRVPGSIAFQFWVLVRKHIMHAMSYGTDWASDGELLRDIEDNSRQLWIFLTKERSVIGAAITKIIVTDDNERAVLVEWLGCDKGRFSSIKDDIIEAMKKFAIENGVPRLVCKGRTGWTRRLRLSKWKGFFCLPVEDRQG